MSNSSEMFKNEQVTHDVSAARKINNLLNSSKTRMEGLELLNSFLPQCPDDDFLHFCINWMQSCCKIEPLTESGDFAINLLCNLLKTSSSHQELKKSVSFFITTRYFDFFFKYFLNSQAGWSCTETCLLLYRGACGPFQENLEKHLKNEINKNVKISSVFCKCFALMPSAGGGGKEGINYKKNWKNYFIEFLNICQSILNDLFVDFEELQQESEILDDSHKKKEKSTEYLVIQLYNHSRVLNCMLLNQYPTSKNIPSDLTLRLICRGLSLNSRNIAKKETTEVISLQKVLPDIHYTLLSLLQALIVTCKSQLFPYSHLICKLFKQSLEWTESNFTYGRENPLSRLRISIYETLCNWLAVAGNGSCIEAISSAVVSSAVNDIRFKKDIVFLKEAALKNQSKIKEETAYWIDVTTISGLCLAALKALQCLLKFAGVSFKAEEHKFLQEVTVKLLVEVQKSSTLDVCIPFAISACRMELYSLLLELVHNPCPKWPAPVSLALRLFGKGINDSSPEVSLFCSAALNFTMVIIHPQYDNGGFPLCRAPCNWSRMEVELKEKEPLELGKEKGSEISQGEIPKNSENFPESDKNNPGEKLNDFNGESGVSSDEDSRNTVTFLKDVESSSLNGNGKKTEQALQQMNLPTYEPSHKLRKTSKKESLLEQVKGGPLESHLIKEASENSEMKELAETSLVDFNSAKSVSLESLNEDSQPKTRYFLRSKTKGSSEEPEEASKSMSSPESLSTPSKNLAKITPVLQSAKKRLRTRTVTKIETNNQTEGKIPEKNNHSYEEEDIKAAFDDCFVD